jgi:hypothetical protein
MSNAPPVPTDESIAIPPRPTQFRWSRRVRVTGSFGVDCMYEAITAPDSKETTITIGYWDKGRPEPPTPDQLQDSVLSRFPNARKLDCRDVDVEGRMAAVLARFTRLEELHIGRLEPSEDVFTSLRSLKDLRKLTCELESDSDRETVVKALPGISVLIH